MILTVETNTAGEAVNVWTLAPGVVVRELARRIVPTAAELQAASAQAQIDRIERKQARAVREWILSADAAAKARLSDYEAQIAVLRPLIPT